MRLETDELAVAPAKMMEFFEQFEKERRRVAETLADLQTRLVEVTVDNGIPEEEDEVRRQIPSEMLTYHLAFAREGASEENVTKRSDVMYRKLRVFLGDTKRSA